MAEGYRRTMEKREQMRGVALTIIGGIFWGLAGVFGQYLFQEKQLEAPWMVSIRLVSAGVILLFTVYLKQGVQMFAIWKNLKDALHILLFGVLGMAACQLSYYVTVAESNAGTATVIQYTAPIMIMVYLAVRNRKMPGKGEMAALILAVAGTVLLATHGNITSLAISQKTLIWGLASAVAMMLYNLIPGQLMNKYGTFAVIGWGMLIGGIFLCLFTKPLDVPGIWDYQTVLALLVVVLVGTILSFGTYMEGVRLIGAARASLFASVEPLTATIATVAWMKVEFLPIDLLGFICIIGAVVLLSCMKK